MDKLQAIPNGN